MKRPQEKSHYIYAHSSLIILWSVLNLLISATLIINNEDFRIFNITFFCISFFIFTIIPKLKKRTILKLQFIIIIELMISTTVYSSIFSPYCFNTLFFLVLAIKDIRNIKWTVSGIFLFTVVSFLNYSEVFFKFNVNHFNLIYYSMISTALALLIIAEVKINNLYQISKILTKKVTRLEREHELYLSRLTHQIRTPLNAFLGGYHYLLFNSKKNLSNEHSFLQILESARTLLSTFEKLLTFSRIKDKKLKAHIHPLNIDHLVLSCVQNFYQKVNENHNEFTYSVRNLPSYIKSDELVLKQIIQTLLENAFDYTQNGKINLIVQGLDHNILEISVSDTGQGIPKESQDIFKPFIFNKRGNYENKDGLSLSIVSSLVRLLNGQIDFVSNNNLGTTFYLEVPFLPYRESRKKNKVSPINNKILVVDDNPMIAKLISLWIGHEEYLYIYKSNGEEAYEFVKDNNVGVIFMDVQMPIMDGLKCTQKIRSHFNDNFSPIIIGISANDSNEDKERAIKSGMNLFISKPLTKNKILDVLKIYYHDSKLSSKRNKSQHIKLESLNIYDQITKEYEFNKEVTDLVVEQFITSAPKLLDEIFSYLTNGEHLKLSTPLHQLKGLSKSIFHTDLIEILEFSRTNITLQDYNKVKNLINQSILEMSDYQIKIRKIS